MTEERIWFEAGEETVAAQLVNRADEITGAMAARYARVGDLYRLYGDAYGAGEAERLPLHRTLRNVIAEAIDAKNAELCQDVPRTVITLRDASWRAREQARLWTWYADHAYVEQHLPTLTYQASRDSLIGGLGAAVVLDEPDGPKLQRVHPMDVLIDDVGCRDMDPPEVILRWRLPRRWLAERHPELEEELLHAHADVGAQGRDCLEVFEGWYESTEGRHVKAVRGLTTALADEPWHGRPPWVRLRINPPLSGLWGRSAVEQAVPLQLERNLVADKIQEGIYWYTPKLLAFQGVIPDGALDNVPDEVIETTLPPTDANIRQIVMQAVHPEVYLREQALDQAIFESIGASRQFATGEMPPQEESGRARRIRYVIRSRQLKTALVQIQHFVEDAVKELVRAELRMAEADPGRSVSVTVSGVTKDIAASALSLDVDSLQVRAKTAASLALDAASEFEELRELHEDGLIDTDELWYRAAQLDLDGVEALHTSHLGIIHQHIDSILWDGKARHPEKYLDFDRAIALGTKALMKAQTDGAPEERLILLREWIDICVFERAELLASAASAMPAPVPPVAPPGQVVPTNPLDMGGNGQLPVLG